MSLIKTIVNLYCSNDYNDYLIAQQLMTEIECCRATKQYLCEIVNEITGNRKLGVDGKGEIQRNFGYEVFMKSLASLCIKDPTRCVKK